MICGSLQWHSIASNSSTTTKTHTRFLFVCFSILHQATMLWGLLILFVHPSVATSHCRRDKIGSLCPFPTLAEHRNGLQLVNSWNREGEALQGTRQLSYHGGKCSHTSTLPRTLLRLRRSYLEIQLEANKAAFAMMVLFPLPASPQTKISLGFKDVNLFFNSHKNVSLPTTCLALFEGEKEQQA